MIQKSRHHFAAWSTDRTGLGGLAKIAVAPDESHSKCTNCGIFVKMGTSGGVKFWSGGRWVSKRPPCQKSEH